MAKKNPYGHFNFHNNRKTKRLRRMKLIKISYDFYVRIHHILRDWHSQFAGVAWNEATLIDWFVRLKCLQNQDSLWCVFINCIAATIEWWLILPFSMHNFSIRIQIFPIDERRARRLSFQASELNTYRWNYNAHFAFVIIIEQNAFQIRSLLLCFFALRYH